MQETKEAPIKGLSSCNTPILPYLYNVTNKMSMTSWSKRTKPSTSYEQPREASYLLNED